MHGGRAMFCGVHENDRPGSIQIINFAYEKIFEVQAHSAPLERLRISPDNQYIYSTGQDYMLAIFNV
jgi:hypothetical protein